MIRSLTAADSAETLALLRERPIHNVFLDYVVSIGGLEWAKGLIGFIGRQQRIGAVLMVGPMGGTVLEVRDPEAHPELARAAAALPVRPRHLTGSEDVTEPFWKEYAPCAPGVRWTRREPVYVLDAAGLARAGLAKGCGAIERADERDLDTVVMHSALQHCEDLKDDRHGMDPEGFVERHRKDLRDGRWWVVREQGRIAFQVHVGVRNPDAVQIGGVFTPPDLRNRGHATRGIAAICGRLLDERPRISLFCAEDNLAARRVYDRVGFCISHQNRSWLLDEPLVAESAAYA